MNFFITGSSGFLSYHLCKNLKKEGHYLIGVDVYDSKNSFLNEFYSLDITKKSDSLEDLINKCDVIIHLAGITEHHALVNTPLESLEINLSGIKNLMEIFNSSERCRTFCFTSTGKVYGDIEYLPINESHPTNPLNILGKTKIIAENLIRFYNTKNKKVGIFRIFNIFGDYQKKTFLIPTILDHIEQKIKTQNNKPIEILLGDIYAKRDFVFVEDVVDAIITFTTHQSLLGFQIYNIGSGISISAQEIILSLPKEYNISVKGDISFVRADEKSEEFSDCTKAKVTIKFKNSLTVVQYISEKIKTLLSKN